MVMGGDSCSKGCGFESRHQCILDGHFHINLLQNLFEKTEKNDKRGRGWFIFKKIKIFNEL